MRSIADALTSDDGFGLKSITIKNTYISAKEHKPKYDFVFVYDFAELPRQAQDWTYFNEKFLAVADVIEGRLSEKTYGDIIALNFNYGLTKIYSQFRLFLLVFVRFLESFQRKSCAALLMLLGFKFEQNCYPC